MNKIKATCIYCGKRKFVENKEQAIDYCCLSCDVAMTEYGDGYEIEASEDY